MNIEAIEIGQDDLQAVLEALSEEQLHRLPFGVVRLDEAGKTVFYSETEGRQSGFGERRTLGRHFFTQIAPCMDTKAFNARIEQARKAGFLDIRFAHVGDFEDEHREIDMRVMSSSDGGLWLCLQRGK